MESASDTEQSVESNYRSRNDTPDDPEDDDSEHTATSESTKKLPIIPVERKSIDKAERELTPSPDRQTEKSDQRKLTPPLDR